MFVMDSSATPETDLCKGFRKLSNETLHPSDDVNDVPRADEAAATAVVQTQGQPTTLSKKQQRKLAKQKRILANLPERRRLEKEKRRLKKLQLAEARKQNCGDDDCSQFEKIQKKLMSESDNKFKVVIDLDFEGYMTDHEIAKAAKQCRNAYAMNRKSTNPCQLYISSLKGKIRDRFAISCAGFENWDVNISQLDYVDMFLSDTSSKKSAIQGNNCDKTACEAEREKIKQKIIYLTGDTKENLPAADEILKDDSVIFVIGGLVDHNRHKNLCYERAKERQIRTAKLPIIENLRLCQRHILSTVTVFDILLNVLGERKSWRESLIAAIPRRKIHPSEFDVEEGEDLTEKDVISSE